MDKLLRYEDVLLVPNYSELNHRANADTSVLICGRKFNLPVIPANMETVINKSLAKQLSEAGFFYIMHRFGQDPISKWTVTTDLIHTANKENWKLISVSTGVEEESIKDLEWVKSAKMRVDFICIDVAHGHHSSVKRRILWIKENLPNSKIIAGNVATPEAVNYLGQAGADLIKVGIGQGKICTTRFETGFSIPMFSCVKACALSGGTTGKFYSYPVVADGGVQHIGDIAKAIVAGAELVMCGGLFAACKDSPAKVVNGQKQYYGSTSIQAKKTYNHIEGKLVPLECDVRTFAEKLEDIKQALQSAISYSGGQNIYALRDKVNFVIAP